MIVIVIYQYGIQCVGVDVCVWGGGGGVFSCPWLNVQNLVIYQTVSSEWKRTGSKHTKQNSTTQVTIEEDRDISVVMEVSVLVIDM